MTFTITQRRNLRVFLCYCALAVFMFYILFPLYWMLLTSFKTNLEISSDWKFPFWFEKKPTLFHYKELFFSDWSNYPGATDCWHHDTPSGPKGRYRGALWFTWGLWQFCKEKTAAKELLTHLLEKEQQYKLLAAGEGYDMPQIMAFYDHKVWSEQGPPVGSLYNYPVRGDERLIIGGYPAPPWLAVQIYNQSLYPTMAAKACTGKLSQKDAIKWAAREMENYME